MPFPKQKITASIRDDNQALAKEIWTGDNREAVEYYMVRLLINLEKENRFPKERVKSLEDRIKSLEVASSDK